MLGERIHTATKFDRLGKLALAAMLSTGLTAAFATPLAWGQTAQTAGRSDADIQSDVAYALSNSAALKGQQITAATVEGDVTVSGNVRDNASKELAESLIYRVNGVRSVTNNLTVGNAPTAQADGQPGADANQQQDPNYDPAQQNMAPAGPQDQGQNPPMPEEQQDQSQYPPQQGQYPAQQGQYPPQQGQYPAPQAQEQYPPQQNGQYSQQQPYNNAPQQPAAPVTVPAGTLLQVRTSEPLDATKAQPGQLFQATVAADVYQGGVLALPRGAVITGKVVATTTNKGDLAGKQGLSLALTSVNLDGKVYPLPTDTWSGQGPGKGAYSATNTIGGAALGALIGAIAGRGPGAAIGAGVGGAAGAVGSAASSGPRMYLPAEAVVNFHLSAPVTVTPVSPQQAQRLAANSTPQLRQRSPYPYPYGPYGAYPPPPPPGYYYGYRYPTAYYPYYYGYRY